MDCTHKRCLADFAGAVKAIYSAIDFSKDGINDVVIGRDTGSIEIYGFDQQQQPMLLFSTCFEESINSIDGGFFTSPNVQVTLHFIADARPVWTCILSPLWSMQSC